MPVSEHCMEITDSSHMDLSLEVANSHRLGTFEVVYTDVREPV